MKKLILCAIAALSTLVASAQSANELYNKYSGRKGVEAVYISPAMFKMMKTLPDMDIQGKEDLDISPIVQNLEGMYVIEIENFTIPFMEDVKNLVKSHKLELMMESREEGETTQIFFSQKDGVVTEFVVVNAEKNEVDFVCFTGKMNMDDLSKLMNKN